MPVCNCFIALRSSDHCFYHMQLINFFSTSMYIDKWMILFCNYFCTYHVTVTTYAHQKIVGLNISVNKEFWVNILDIRYHLIGEHENSFYGKPSRTESQEIFERRSKKIHHQNIPVPFLSVPLRKQQFLFFLSNVTRRRIRLNKFSLSFILLPRKHENLPSNTRYRGPDRAVYHFIHLWFIQQLRMLRSDIF